MGRAEANPVEALRWSGAVLEIIDQRLLPDRLVYRACDSAAAVAEAIRTLAVRGAPAIGCAAAYGVALEAARLRDEAMESFVAGVRGALEVLAASRPTAVNLFWALARMRAVLEDSVASTPAVIADRMLVEARQIQADDVARNRAIGAFGAELLADSDTVLTHCNAGALATGGYGTALGVIRSAVAAGKRISVMAGETRPLLQGARLTAWELLRDAIPVTLITDNMVGHLMSRGEIDAVVVGADRVAANGDVANKIGTYTIAVLARRHGIPFYVACPLSTLDPDTPTGDDIPIEERGADEVTGFRDTRWAPAAALARNPSFDVTPADLVTGLITERGVVLRPDRTSLAALFTEAGEPAIAHERN